MPIGVPRIIYCWGEELPAQWTDIYNFIFRRRMIFLMQYLDDELCNQICGLLINIHMEDRSKELEKKEIERSGLFKTASKAQKTQNVLGDSQIGLQSTTSNIQGKKKAGPAFEDLLAADEDLGIDENNTLEQYTLQKITMEWLNWNAQFFDYSDEPYLFYLAEMLSKDFNNGDARMLSSTYKTGGKGGIGAKEEGTGLVSPPFEGRCLTGGKNQIGLGLKASRTGLLYPCPLYPPLPPYYVGGYREEGGNLGYPVREAPKAASFMQFFEHFSSNSQTKLKNDWVGLGLVFPLVFSSKRKPEGENQGKSDAFKGEPPAQPFVSQPNLAPSKEGVKRQNPQAIFSGGLRNPSAPPKEGVERGRQAELLNPLPARTQKTGKLGHLDIYSPFRLLANFAAQDFNFREINPLAYSGLHSNVASPEENQNPGFEKRSFLGSALKKAQAKLFTQPPTVTNDFNKKKEVSKRELFKLFNNTLKKKGLASPPFEGQSIPPSPPYKDERADQNQVRGWGIPYGRPQNNNMSKLITELGRKNFSQKLTSQGTLFKTSEKALSQRNLRKEYVQDKTLNAYQNSKTKSQSKAWGDSQSFSLRGETNQYNQKTDPLGLKNSFLPLRGEANYLDFYSYNDSYTEFSRLAATQRGKQTERTFQEEEAKKVFVIINSFGGSVGNGITVHDALQFIKAGSLTLALGVAASAASLALAGGTIGERYVTEGCHVMIHQPESSIQGQASDIWIDSQEIMKIRLDVAEIYSLATYRPRHKILRDLDRDFYLTATETIHYGLADEIATNEVMHEIIEMTSKVWDYHDTKQQRLLESRDNSNSGLDTQSQN